MNTVYDQSHNFSPAVKAILDSARDWREATRLVITNFSEENRPFSSGEIAMILRVYRPDMAFSVGSLGEYVRDMYVGNEFPNVDDGVGQPVYPSQVPRITTGAAQTFTGEFVQGRTPAGQVVFVYGETNAAQSHNFEVYIPLPPNQTDNPTILPGPAGSPGSIPALPTTPKQLGVLITGKLAKDDLTASVRQDGRLCVSRSAFEAFVGLTGRPLRAGPNGDPIWVNVEGTPARTVVITLDPTPGAEEYHLWVNRGRLAFAPPVGTNWTAGEKFNVTVEQDKITVDVSTSI